MSGRLKAWPLTVALLLGAGGVPGFAPLGWFPLTWLSLAGLFGLLCGETDGQRWPWRGAALVASHALGLFLAGVSWIYVSLSVFGGLPAVVAALATFLFCLLLALLVAPVGALFVWLAPTGRRRRVLRVLLFAGLWTLAEWVRSWAFTGFPWLAVGYAQSPPSPLAGYAPLVGVHGVSLIVALLAALAFDGLRPGSSSVTESGMRAAGGHRGRVLPLLAIALLLGGGEALRGVRWTEAVGEPLSVALLQGNVDQGIKWRPDRFIDSLRTYYRLALDHPAQLTVLPETALPAFFEQVPVEYFDDLTQLARRRRGDLLLGIPVSENNRYFNAAISLGAGGTQRYDKVHLVPFGEFAPPGFAWFMALIDIPLADFTPGQPARPPLRLAGQQVAVNICYEDAFGAEIIAALPAATLLVNISNVAWFGDSLAPAQHLQIARMRALETGRMMLRATNTGMTAIIDIDGRVLSALPAFARGALVGEVRGHAGATPYARWGNGPLLLVAFLLVAASAERRRRA